EKAVPWTKPEDFSPDKAKPITGLAGLRHGTFLALGADGACHVVPADVEAATLNALFTRAGGEAVSFPEPPAAAEAGTEAAPAPPQTAPEPENAPAPQKPTARPPDATHK